LHNIGVIIARKLLQGNAQHRFGLESRATRARNEWLELELRNIDRAVTRSTCDAGGDLGPGLRPRATRGGLGQRLADNRCHATERAEGPSSSGPAEAAADETAVIYLYETAWGP
jgi:hypothetical protein